MKVLLYLTTIFTLFISCGTIESLFGGGGDPPSPYKLNNPKDSLFVRELLDSNGLTTTPASRVMDIQSNRLVSIVFYPKSNILVLPSVIDSLPKGITISAGLNLDSIKVDVKLRNPIQLSVHDNKFKNYPNSLFNLAENSYVEISYNQITTLPDEIMSFKFSRFGFNYNHICSPSDTLRKWLNEHYPNWEKYQTCP